MHRVGLLVLLFEATLDRPAAEVLRRGVGVGASPVEAQVPSGPACDARAAVPPVAGHLSDGRELVLDAGCSYKIWDANAASRCLSGSWTIIQGASNGLLMFHTLLMMLAPDSGDELREGRFGGRDVIDVFIQDGKIISYSTVPSVGTPCEDVRKGTIPTSEPTAPGCYYKQPTAGNGNCDGPYPSWHEDIWGRTYVDSWANEAACLGRKHGHDAQCGTNTTWRYIGTEATPVTVDAYGACKKHLADHWATLPAHSSSVTRLTIFTWFFWTGTSVLADVVDSDTRWAAAEVSLVVQVSAWYAICNYIKTDECPRKELISMTQDEALGEFNADLDTALGRLATFCAPGGRAGRRGCVVGSKSWSAAKGPLGDAFARFDAAIVQAMQSRSSTTLRFMDFFTLGASMPDQTIMGHGSQILHGWAWQVMLGGFCPAEAELANQALTKVEARFTGALCSAGAANLDLCPKYHEACDHWGRCNLWMCMNSIPCKLDADPAPVVSRFTPDAQGAGKACRGAAGLGAEESYRVVHNTQALDECKAECIKDESCRGIEFSLGRCEVWRTEIVRTELLSGFTCLSLGAGGAQAQHEMSEVQLAAPPKNPQAMARRRRRTLRGNPLVATDA